MNFYSMWQGYTQADVADRNFRSDALQVSVQKRTFQTDIGGLSAVLSYTFSKQYSLTCCQYQSWSYNTGGQLVLGPGAGVAGTQIVTFPFKNSTGNLVYAPDSANKPQEIAFHGVWNMPFGKGKKFATGAGTVAEKIVGGWQMDWILSYVSGNFVGLPNQGGINFCGDYTHYIDPVTNQPTGQTPNHWFNNNPSCYGNLPANAINLGNPPRFAGNVENPAAPQLNIALEKNTQIGERYKLQFRAESFNLTNTPIRPGPGSTSFTSPVFGIIPNAQNNFPRLVQLALKLYF
jgi:hypothetical protein